MNPLICPRCAQVDQVQSVQSIYNSQSGVTHLTHNWDVGGGQSHGTLTSNLALRLSPPPVPRRQSATGCGTAAALIGAIVFALICVDAGITAGTNPAFIVLAIGALCVVPFVINKDLRRGQILKREYEEYAAVWPAMVQVWQNSIVCLRCHGVFFPSNVPIPGHGYGQLIPIDAFHAAVTDIGTRLVLASPEPPDRHQPLPPAAS